MKREYILEAEATSIPVLPKGQRVKFRNIDEAFEAGWKTCQEYIATCIEPADVEERKTAQWIPSDIPDSILDKCSECGFDLGANTYRYCPMCGAKMEKLIKVEELEQGADPGYPPFGSYGDSVTLAPAAEEWEPDPEDVDLVSRTIWGETRGCPSEEQEGVGWCIVLRKNSPQFPDTIRGVVLQPNQWQGYSPNNPAEPFRDMARDILIRDHNGEAGPLPEGFFWCSGDGKHQRFRNTWLITAETEYWP